LKSMAGDGQLNSDTEIRLGKTPQWVEAHSLHLSLLKTRSVKQSRNKHINN
jgi:hypothetical protein